MAAVGDCDRAAVFLDLPKSKLSAGRKRVAQRSMPISGATINLSPHTHLTIINRILF
jgi:hypothetical protein